VIKGISHVTQNLKAHIVVSNNRKHYLSKWLVKVSIFRWSQHKKSAFTLTGGYEFEYFMFLVYFDSQHTGKSCTSLL
jgi:hypothetical protein